MITRIPILIRHVKSSIIRDISCLVERFPLVISVSNIEDKRKIYLIITFERTLSYTTIAA